MKMPISILFALLFALALPRAAMCGVPGPVETTATAVDFIRNIEAGASIETVSLGKKPSSLDYDITSNRFYIGRRDMLRFYYNDSDTGISKNSATHRFDTTIHTEEFGITATARYALLPKQTFQFSIGKKETHTDNYNDYTWMPLAGAWNVDPVGQAEVESTPVSISWKMSLPKKTRVGVSWQRENVKLNTIAGLSVRTNIYTATAVHDIGKFTVDGSFSKLTTNCSHSNTHTGLRVGWRPIKNGEISLRGGMYSHGAPTAGGVFSDIGSQYIFSYLAGETKFDPIFNDKLGYIALGINFYFPGM